jgi:DNA-binding winged helix-turn-helix (wHTH) protein/tetratricopeptide (TPR) repeat protein
VIFGPFRLDSTKRVLWRGDQLVHLPPKALDVLLALAEQAGDVVSKDELISRVWPDTFVEEANLSVNVAALRKALGTREDGGHFIETIPKRGYRLLGAAARAPDPARQAVAVLPFRVLGGAPEDQYLGHGLTDALITHLARSPALAVRPTRAVLRFAASTDAREAGRALSAERVVDGTLQRAGSRLRLSLQLLEVDKPRITWSTVLEDDASRLFQLQDAAAEQVGRALGLPAATSARAAPAAPSTEAYRAYLKGRYFWSRFTGPWLEKALAFFHESAEADPAYAPPHAGIAQLDLVLGFSGVVHPRDAWEAAEDAAQKALSRDSGLADAHVALGYVRLFRDWDWRFAEEALGRAVAAEPNAAAPRHWLALLLLLQGGFPAAKDELARAEVIDPLSVLGAALAGLHGQLAGDDAAALASCRRTLELEPGHFLGHWGCGLALQQLGHHAEAIESHRKALELAGDAPLLRPVLARSLALAGDHEGARALLEPAEGTAFTSPYQKATVELALGETARALSSLEQACEERDPWVVLLKSDRLLAPLRGEPRYLALLARVFGTG